MRIVTNATEKNVDLFVICGSETKYCYDTDVFLNINL